LITGGASFLGQAISRYFAQEGFDLALHYQSSRAKTQTLEQELRTSGVRAVPLRADLRNDQAASTLVRETIKVFGRIDILVNNASLFLPTLLRTGKAGEWKKLLAVNLIAPYLLAQASYPWLRKTKGSIVNVTDIYGQNPILRDHGAYQASKAGLINATKSLAMEMGPDVRVNAVSPGAFFIPKTYGPARKKDLIARSFLKRQGRPEELAWAVHFLAVHPFVTGQVLNVDGGRSFS
jgi:pteridine reductase